MLARFNLKRVNRIASLAIVPLMALAIVAGSRFLGGSSAAPQPPREGLLVVADLRGESLFFLDFETGARSELALPGPPHELAAIDGRLYVTLARGNAVAEVEPAAPGILRLLHLDGEPHGLAAGPDGNVYVTLDKGNALVEVDRASFSVIARFPTGDTPHTVAFAGLTALVTDSRDNRLQALVGSTGSANTGTMPESVATNGARAITADVESGTLTVVDSGTMRAERTIRVGGAPVRVVALDATTMAVALNGASSVAIVDVTSGKVLRTIKTLGHPDGICLSPSGAYLAVASNEGKAVQIFRRSDWALAGTLAAGEGPGSCAWIARH